MQTNRQLGMAVIVTMSVYAKNMTKEVWRLLYIVPNDYGNASQPVCLGLLQGGREALLTRMVN